MGQADGLSRVIADSSLDDFEDPEVRFWEVANFSDAYDRFWTSDDQTGN